jgi:hypothetical protein
LGAGQKGNFEKRLNYRNPNVKKYGLKLDKYKTVTEDFKESEHQNKG